MPSRRSSVTFGWPGPWFNIKMLSYQYRKSHCGDKTILRPSYLHNGISYTGKMTSLYWIRYQSLYGNSMDCFYYTTNLCVCVCGRGGGCCFCPVTPTVLDGFFAYQAQMITSMRGCLVHNDFDFDLYLQDHSAMTCNKTAKTWHILSYPLYSIYSSAWILSKFGTNDH